MKSYCILPLALATVGLVTGCGSGTPATEQGSGQPAAGSNPETEAASQSEIDPKRLRFSLRSIGTAPGYEGSEAQFINSSGLVLARAWRESNYKEPPSKPDGNNLAFLFDDGTITPVHDGEHGGHPCGLNDRADVAAVSTFSSIDARALLWTKGKSTFITAGSSQPTAMNNAGVVFGYFASDKKHIFRWHQGELTKIPVPEEFGRATPIAMNASELLAGTKYAKYEEGGVRISESRGWTYKDGKFKPLPVREADNILRGRTKLPTVEVRDVNADGDVIGFYACLAPDGSSAQGYVAKWPHHAPEEIVLMGDLVGGPDVCNPQATNNAGWVVGWGTSESGQRHAVVWTPDGKPLDLNEHFDESGNGWVLTEARDINDRGQIVGHGLSPQKEKRGFVLTPIK